MAATHAGLGLASQNRTIVENLNIHVRPVMPGKEWFRRRFGLRTEKVKLFVVA